MSDLSMVDGFVKRSGEKPDVCRKRLTAQFDRMYTQVLQATIKDYPDFTTEITDVDAFVAKQEQLKQTALGVTPGYALKNVTELINNGMVELKIEYPASTSRNFEEVLRVIDSLQLTARHSVATPVNWKQGEYVIIASSLNDEVAKQKFPNGWKAPKPYIRIVPQPVS